MIPEEIQITENDIKENCINSYYSRGVSYYNTNKVENCIIDEIYEDFLLLLGAVKGSNRSIYSQSIEITDEFENDDIVIEGQCSCPVGYNCKHVVAVCIYYLEKMQYSYKKLTVRKEEKSEVDMWLENLETTNLDKSNSEYFITYRLFASDHPYHDHPYHKDELQFFKSKFLKNGSISKGT